MQIYELSFPYESLINASAVLNKIKGIDIELSGEEFLKIVNISNLLKSDPTFKLWAGQTPQVNWKADNTTYMWRQTIDIVEVAVNSNWEDMGYYTPEELIKKLKRVEIS